MVIVLHITGRGRLPTTAASSRFCKLEKIVYFVQMAGLLSPREAALRLGISYPTFLKRLRELGIANSNEE